MTNSNKYHENLTFPDREADSLPSRRYVGGSALIHFEDTPIVRGGSDTPESFEHLFPAMQLSHRVNEASTAEGAEQLLDELKDGDPYKNYALSHLALYFMNRDELEHAHELLHRITDSGTATDVLSQLIMYADDHKLDILPRDQLGRELHELAIHAYDVTPSAQSARAVGLASEALPEDSELYSYAQKALAEHPEVRPQVSSTN